MSLFKKTTKKQEVKKSNDNIAPVKNTVHQYHQHFIIKQPLVTERTLLLGEKNQYVFLIDNLASKSEAKKQIEKMYSVNIIKINSLNQAKKPTGYRGVKNEKKRFKKVIATLKPGQKIEITGNK
ncbi:MAG: 50S ribosomal protein L23 [Candidatus Paceibacterota bacterium]|jgi:large subunit ribosomal protein L23